MIEYKTRLYWGDLTYEAQERVKAELVEYLKLDKDLMADVEQQANEDIAEIQECGRVFKDKKEFDDYKLWKIGDILESKAETHLIAHSYIELSI